jgi:hypothetical protein
MKRVLPYGADILATIVFSVLSITLTHAGEGDLDLRAKLIWATNGDKPKDPRLKEIDPKTAEKLAGVFKWKNYFEVGRTNFTVTVGATRKVTMSPKCDVKVQNLGGARQERHCMVRDSAPTRTLNHRQSIDY